MIEKQQHIIETIIGIKTTDKDTKHRLIKEAAVGMIIDDMDHKDAIHQLNTIDDIRQEEADMTVDTIVATNNINQNVEDVVVVRLDHHRQNRVDQAHLARLHPATRLIKIKKK